MHRGSASPRLTGTRRRPTTRASAGWAAWKADAQALPFYLDFLGFTLDWEHRFEPGTPLYVQVSRSAAVLHLSEHHGDGSPNGVVWVPVRDVSALHKELLTRPNAPMRPGIDHDAPGGPTLQVIDPYGNVLRFAQPPSAR